MDPNLGHDSPVFGPGLPPGPLVRTTHDHFRAFIGCWSSSRAPDLWMDELRASTRVQWQLYLCVEELLHRRCFRIGRVPQRPRPGAPASGQPLAHRRRVNPCAATGQSPPGIGNNPPLGQHDSEQARHTIPLTAPDAGAHRATDRTHDSTVNSAHGSLALAASERMSMRHPVIRAASRAFCPSRPIASDN